MADKKYPVLYATSVKGTIFRHCGIYNTIYFNIYNNKDAVIELNGSLSDNTIYLGKSTTLNFDTKRINLII